MNLEIKSQTLRNHIGKVVWIRYKLTPNRWIKEIIFEVVRKNIRIDGDWKHFGQIYEIRTDNPNIETNN